MRPRAATMASAWSENVAPGQFGKETASAAEARLADQGLHQLPISGIAACARNQDEASLLHDCHSGMNVQRPVTHVLWKCRPSTVSACP